ncbi:MAG: hypothetical protein IPO81_08790 [Kouleothrix sp.]|nr:hypothetical protein [Kouleothrix sp.]
MNALAGVVEKAALDDRKSKTRGRSKSTKKDGTSDGTMADSSGAWQLSDTLFGAAPGSKSSDLGGPSGTGAPALGMLDRNLRTPQVLLNFDKLAIDNTWLDQHGNLLDDHLMSSKMPTSPTWRCPARTWPRARARSWRIILRSL